MKYGSQIMIAIFHYAVDTERYEDCAQIKEVLQKYNIDSNQDMEDYRAYFWRLGMSGDTAIANLNHYLREALQSIGYPEDAVGISL